jgi:gamma-glutamylcysteine synthetase
MPIRKIQGKQKRKKALERYKNRVPLPAMMDKKQQDIAIIDKALESLYNDGDKVIRSLQEDILQPNKVTLSEKDTARLWDLMVNTGLVHPVIGFGNSGKLDLTNEGYQLMSQFGSYSAFLQEHQRQQLAQQNQQMAFPQFIIEQSEEGKEDGEQGEEKAVGKKKQAGS